jgi:serine/threonine protein kinase
MRTPSTDHERTAVADCDWLPGYELLSVVGAGGFGTVYKARQLKLDRLVAVKVIPPARSVDPAAAARFEQEAVALGKFRHPNIVQVYDYGYHHERLFIVMELLEGEDLAQRLRREGRLDERTAWAIARQAAAALYQAASCGVVHRDVKPANLFLVPAPTGIGLPPGVPMVKVTDFGLALSSRAVEDPDGRLTAPGSVPGTPAYMAPEQYRRTTFPDHRADIYALGATVFHALTGRPPFEGATVWALMEQKLLHAPRLGDGVSAQSAELIAAMMAPDPDDRIETYGELIERIDRIATPSGVSMAPPGPDPVAASVRTAPAPRDRRPWAWAAAAGLLVAASIGVGVSKSWWPRPPASPATRASGRYTSVGPQQALYDGESIAGWLPPASGGAWQVEPDDEGAVVFTGTGFVRRSVPHFEDYRVTMGLDVHRAAAAEVHFAIPARTPTGDRLALRVSRTGGAVLGTRAGDRGEFRPLREPVLFPSPGWFDGRRPYLEVRFARAGGVWAVWFNGAEAGRLADDGVPKAAEVRLYAEGGPARVDSVVLEKLEETADARR